MDSGGVIGGRKIGHEFDRGPGGPDVGQNVMRTNHS